MSSVGMLLTTDNADRTVGDRHPFTALKESDLIVVGVATNMTIVPLPTVPANSPGVNSHGRLKVRVKRTVIPPIAKVADPLEIDYGYNPGDYSWNAYKDKELVYILKATAWDTNGVITGAKALRFWTFAYRPEDLGRVLELRSHLRAGVDPKSLTNNIPKAVFSAQ